MTDEALVLNYILTDFLPNLWLPLVIGLGLLGLVTQFFRRVDL